ncbi:NAD(P)H-binding protein [Modestobacter sp. NPDC049651]|uniref:SDR family oxidoreductase n=1 Tax=unclassified Modestobacter TaxID=2643866 RepID=UPI0033C761CF
MAGGTGLTGRLVVEELRQGGHETVVLARSRGVDLLTGQGLDDALAGCDTVVDVTNVGTMRRAAAVEFFGTTAATLTAAAARAGVGHLLVLSIVGVDRADLGYYVGKRRQEELVTGGPVPWTVLRTTQFLEFAGQLLAASRGPVAVLPRMLSQPVAVGEVAARLAELATTAPAGYARELAGPEQLQVADMARAELRARHQRRLVLPVRLPGATGRALAGGALLPQGDHDTGRRTFAEHLGAVAA